MVIARGRRVEGGGDSYGREGVKEGDLTQGGEHPIQCTDGCRTVHPKCIILLTSVTPINSVKRTKRKCFQINIFP